MPRALAFLLAAAMALPGCSDRPVAEERESHRHLAQEWCADWCPFWYACEPAYADQPVSECQASCEGDEWWDWTDECGDIRWEVHECWGSLTCEEALNDPDIPGTDDPCQPYLDELVIKECTYDRPHGE
jgi:hypothetical protein